MVIKNISFDVESANIEDFKNSFLDKKTLEIKENLDGTLSIFPKFKTSLPFASKKKSSSNYYYIFFFNKNVVKVSYTLKKTAFYSLVFNLFLVVTFSALTLFYPQITGILIIFLLSLLILIITLINSFNKSKLFLDTEILNNIR